MLKQLFFPLTLAMNSWCKIWLIDSEKILTIRVVLWLPKVEELEQQEELPPLVIKLSTLQGKKGLHLSPNTLALTSLITQYATKKPTKTVINATIMLHGITRSKELVDSFYKLGMGSVIQMCYFYMIFGLCMILNSAVCSAPTLYLCKLLNLFSAPPIVKEDQLVMDGS